MRIRRQAISSLHSRQNSHLSHTRLAYHMHNIRAISYQVSRRVMRQPHVNSRHTRHLITTFSTRVTQIRIIFNSHSRHLHQGHNIRARHISHNLLPDHVTIRYRRSAQTRHLPLRLRKTGRLRHTRQVIHSRSTGSLHVLNTRYNTTHNSHHISTNRVRNRRVNVTFSSRHLTFLRGHQFNGISTMRRLYFTMRLHIKHISMFHISHIVLMRLTHTRTGHATNQVTGQPYRTTARVIMCTALTLANRSHIRRLLLNRTFTNGIPRRIVPSLKNVSTTRPLTINLTRITAIRRLTHNRHLLNRRLKSRRFLHHLINFRRAYTFQANIHKRIINFIMVRFSVMFINRRLRHIAGISILLVFSMTRRITTRATTRTVPCTGHQTRKGA